MQFALPNINKLFQLAVVWHKVLCQVLHRKHTKSNGTILVAGKRLNLGVRGTRREALLGGDKISGTGGSHPGQDLQ